MKYATLIYRWSISKRKRHFQEKEGMLMVWEFLHVLFFFPNKLLSYSFQSNEETEAPSKY